MSAAPAPPVTVVRQDVATGIQSDSDAVISPRYMRHLLLTPDGTQVLLAQQGDNGGLALYKSLDDGQSWQWEQDLPSTSLSVSDALVLPDGDLLVVTSVLETGPIEDVVFLRLDYDAATRHFALAPGVPVTIFSSSQAVAASRATLARDSNGVLWSAFRWRNGNTNNVRLRLYYSVDDGTTWTATSNLLGSANAWTQKNAKVVSTGSGIGVVVQDVAGSGAATV